MAAPLSLMLAQPAADATAESGGWLGVVAVAVLLLIFVLFGWAIWRAVDPKRWAPACERCGKHAGHAMACPLRPPPAAADEGGDFAGGILGFLIEALLGGDD